MKTKPFLLATAGSTVDGRLIDEKMIKEMASSYDPKTYGARLNIEHIRGISGDGPFHSYGDVLELSTGEVEVNFNGKTEKRLGLYGVLDVLDNATKLNKAGQKLYPSIEIHPNFAEKGFAYLMGCALTDSPAAVATERMQFNRALPGSVRGHAQDFGIAEAPLEFEEPAQPLAPEVGGMFKSISAMIDKFTGAAPAPEVKPEAKPEATDFAAFKPILEGFATTMETALTKQAEGFTGALNAIKADVTALSTKIDTTAAPHTQRPPGTGPGGQFTLTNC